MGAIIAVSCLLLLGYSWQEFVFSRGPWPPQAVATLLNSTAVTLMGMSSALISLAVIRRQHQNGKELESIKSRLGRISEREDAAYHSIWKAVATSYRVLTQLESGYLNAADCNKLEELFQTAETDALIVAIEHENIFYEYWQMINEVLAKAKEVNFTERDAKELWRRQAGIITEKRNEIKNTLTASLRVQSEV